MDIIPSKKMGLDKRDRTRIQTSLEKLDLAREDLLKHVREAIRLSGWSIIQTHRDQFDEAEASLRRVEEILGKIDDILTKCPALQGAGNSPVAYQEYVEGKLLLHLTRDGRLPSLKEMKVDAAAYVLGVLDFVGELRRSTLNHLRRGELEGAEEKFSLMEDIYEDLAALDHATIIPTFRKKMDNARRVIESTRGDVVTEIRKISLEKAIAKLGKRLE